jgi:hypothetical protein
MTYKFHMLNARITYLRREFLRTYDTYALKAIKGLRLG